MHIASFTTLTTSRSIPVSYINLIRLNTNHTVDSSNDNKNISKVKTYRYIVTHALKYISLGYSSGRRSVTSHICILRSHLVQPCSSRATDGQGFVMNSFTVGHKNIEQVNMRYTACLPSKRKVEYLRKPKQHGTNKVSKQHLTSFFARFSQSKWSSAWQSEVRNCPTQILVLRLLNKFDSDI